MIKIKASYSNEEEKQKLIAELKNNFLLVKVSKEYEKEGPYKRIHMDLRTK